MVLGMGVGASVQHSSAPSDARALLCTCTRSMCTLIPARVLPPCSLSLHKCTPCMICAFLHALHTLGHASVLHAPVAHMQTTTLDLYTLHMCLASQSYPACTPSSTPVSQALLTHTQSMHTHYSCTHPIHAVTLPVHSPYLCMHTPFRPTHAYTLPLHGPQPCMHPPRTCTLPRYATYPCTHPICVCILLVHAPYSCTHHIQI